MGALNEVAPNLSQYLTEEQAKAAVQATIDGATPPPKVVDLADLSSSERSLLLLWLKWHRSRRIPLEINALTGLLPSMVKSLGLHRATRKFLRLAPKQVCYHLNLEPSFLDALIAEVAAIRAEIQRGEDAFMPAAVTPTIASVHPDTPKDGDLTIKGANFDSYDTKETSVRLCRPHTDECVVRTATQIQSLGGIVTATEIVITSTTVPPIQPGDQVTVRADGLDSSTYTYTLRDKKVLQ